LRPDGIAGGRVDVFHARQPAKLSIRAAHDSLLQIYRHDDVEEILPALEQARAIRGRQLEGDLVAVHDAQGFGQELRVEADLHVAALVFAGEIDFRLARLGAAT